MESNVLVIPIIIFIQTPRHDFVIFCFPSKEGNIFLGLAWVLKVISLQEIAVLQLIYLPKRLDTTYDVKYLWRGNEYFTPAYLLQICILVKMLHSFFSVQNLNSSWILPPYMITVLICTERFRPLVGTSNIA